MPEPVPFPRNLHRFERFARAGEPYEFTRDDALELVTWIDDRVGNLQQTLRGQWQPIETAPTDGREVLLLMEYRAGISGCMLVGPFMPGGFCVEDPPPIE